MWLLNHTKEVQPTPQRSRPRQYGPDVERALFLVWNAANRICAKRLIPFLPTLIEATSALHLTEECAIPTALYERSHGGLEARVLSAKRINVASPRREPERS
jgi:hypothetical protein